MVYLRTHMGCDMLSPVGDIQDALNYVHVGHDSMCLKNSA